MVTISQHHFDNFGDAACFVEHAIHVVDGYGLTQQSCRDAIALHEIGVYELVGRSTVKKGGSRKHLAHVSGLQRDTELERVIADG
jgi:hypothetical protein